MFVPLKGQAVIKPNVYYIILDGMKPVEEAKRTGILDEEPVVQKIEGLGLRYIEKRVQNKHRGHT